MNDVNESITTSLADLLEFFADNQMGVTGPVFGNLNDGVDDITYHDYSTYLYALDPDVVRRLKGGTPWSESTDGTPSDESVDAPSTDASPDALDTEGLELLEAETRQLVEWAIEDVAVTGAQRQAAHELAAVLVRQLEKDLRAWYSSPAGRTARLGSLAIHAIENSFATLVPLYSRVLTSQRSVVEDALKRAASEWVERSALFDAPWVGIADRIDSFPTDGPWYAAARHETWTAAGYVEHDYFQRIQILQARQELGSWTWGYSLLEQEERAHAYAWERSFHDNVPFDPPPSIWYEVQFAARAWTTLFLGENLAPQLTSVEKIVRKLLETADSEMAEVAVALGEAISISIGGLTDPEPVNESNFGFRPFLYPDFNIGIEVTYRQEWFPEGMSKGDLVRTVPLGPGQSEKITTRHLHRDSVRHELMNQEDSEAAWTATDKTTNSSELVSEAVKSKRWEVKADGSLNIGPFGGSVSGPSAGGTSQSMSRDTKRDIAESSRSASTKLRRQRKLTVSTERTTETEVSSVSEIHNPNDEMPVNYFYYALQRQFRVSTYLSRVRPVVFISEPLPIVIDLGWMRRYDWILRKALLDESFRDALEAIESTDTEQLVDEMRVVREKLRAALENVEAAQTSLSGLQNVSGHVEVGSTYDGVIARFDETASEARALVARAGSFTVQWRRLARHIADNILHYQRSIWQHEDVERRRMRLRDLLVPVEFVPVVDGSASDGGGSWLYEGSFQVAEDATYLPLVSIVDPTGPVAFVGNYAVYRLLATQETAGLSVIARQVAQRFHGPQRFTVTSDRRPESNEQLCDVNVTNRDLYSGESLVVKRLDEDVSSGASWEVLSFAPLTSPADGIGASAVQVAPEPVVGSSAGIRLGLPTCGVEVTFASLPEKQESITLQSRQPVVRDPELEMLRREYGCSTDGQLGEALKAAGADVQVACAGDECTLVHTTQLLVDTDNLYLEIQPAPLMEPFKQYHRMLDVAAAAAEIVRRAKRLEVGDLADPDVDNLVIVHDEDGSGVIVESGPT